MPVFNQETFLKKAINSILRQTYKNFEFLILDDGSTDSSWFILKSYKDRRIHLFRNKHTQGLAKGLNYLIEKAKGRYIARMDGDDISSIDRIMLEKKMLDQNNSLDLVGSWAKIINTQGKIIGDIKYPMSIKQIRDKILIFNPFVHSSIMFRKKIYDQLDGYNEKYLYSQDYDFSLRLAADYECMNIPEYLIKYRWQPNFPKQKQQHLAALKIRLYALRYYGYPKWEVIKLIKPFFLYLLPPWLKKIYWQEKFYDKN